MQCIYLLSFQKFWIDRVVYTIHTFNRFAIFLRLAHKFLSLYWKYELESTDCITTSIVQTESVSHPMYQKYLFISKFKLLRSVNLVNPVKCKSLLFYKKEEVITCNTSLIRIVDWAVTPDGELSLLHHIPCTCLPTVTYSNRQLQATCRIYQ